MLCHNCNREIEYHAVCPYCGTRALKEPLPHHLPVGTVIDNRYKVMGVLGEGGFGVTYLGYNQRLGLPVAIKEFFPRGVAYRESTGGKVYSSTDDGAAFFNHGKERFLSEAKTLVRFNAEPGIVSVMDFVDENNTAYLIMEYLDGETLQQYLKKHGTLSADEAFSMLEPMMRTLEKVHKAGIIHRDISPDNIMMLGDGSLKLMDFGAARDYSDENRSMSIMLKKGYAPAEQYQRKGEQGPWTDVYALCATIYRCITGVTPADSLDRMSGEPLKKPSELGAEIPPAYEGLLMYGLALKKEDRCHNMAELLELLDRAKHEYVQKPSAFFTTTDCNRIDPNATVYADSNEYNLSSAQSSLHITKAQDSVKRKKTGIYITIIAVLLVVLIGLSAIISVQFLLPKSIAEKETIQESFAINKSETIKTSEETEFKEDSKEKETEKNSVSERTDSDIVNYEIETINNKKWATITSINAGDNHSVGLREDGTVIATGKTQYGQCDVDGWTNIVAISAGYGHTIGLKRDGTVVATGWNDAGQCNVNGWTDIVEVSAGVYHTVGLKKDGTVVATKIINNNSDKKRDFGQCNVGGWTDIVAVSAGDEYTVGLKKDGTVVAVGSNYSGMINVDSWTDISAISAGDYHTVGLKRDGTVVATGENYSGRCDVNDWKNIIAISAGDCHTVGLKDDGTVVATGYSDDGRCDVDDWTDIVAVSAGVWHTIGLKSDGTVVATGKNDDGQCDVNN